MGSTHNQAAQTVHAQPVHTKAAPAYDWDQLALELSNTAWDTPPRAPATPPPAIAGFATSASLSPVAGERSTTHRVGG